MQKDTEVVRAGGHRGPARVVIGRLLLVVMTILVGAFLLSGALALAAPMPQIASTGVMASEFDASSQPAGVDNVTILLGKEVAPPPNGIYLVGDTIVFTITVENQAGNGGTALLVPLRDVYSPTWLSYVSASPAPNATASGVITWNNVGPILDGAGTTVVVTFTALASGVTTNTAIIQGVIYDSYPPGYLDPGPAYATADIYDADWGDAPDPTYPTLRINNGARHVITGTLWLGATIDPEPDGQPNPTATGDDIAGAIPDDEDGVTFNSPIVPGQVATVTVVASAPGGLLNAWLDFNRDGDWADAGEQIFTNQLLAAGPNILTFNVPPVPTSVLGPTFARFRLNTAGGLSYTGLAMDGEVEDYSEEDGVLIVQPDLTLTKDDGGISTTPGGTVVYTLTLANVSAYGDATGVIISDTVPTNSVFNAGLSSLGWSCVDGAPAGTVCTLSVGTVAPSVGWSETFAITVVNPLPAGVTQITNTAWIYDDGSQGPDPTPANNTDTDTTPVNATPDMTIVKSDGGVSTAPGGTVVYTLTYANVGNQNATGVTITDTVPANSTFNPGASTVGWACVPNNNAGSICTISIGAVAGGGAGGAVTFAVTVVNPLPAGVTQITNTAWVQDDGNNGADPTPANNHSTDTTPVNATPDLRIVKSDGGASSTPGGVILYTLTYSNAGNQADTNVVITDVVPANSTFNAGSSTVGWTCLPNNNAGSTCSLSIGTVAGGGAGGAVTFAVTVVTPLPTGVTQISNTACVAGDEDLGPNCGSDDTPVPATPDMTIVKSDGGVSTVPGGTVVYTLTYANVGNQNATGVTITDTVPANSTFNPGASTVGWACVPNNNAGSICTITIGAVAGGGAGGAVLFAVTVINPLPAGVTQITNTAWVQDDGNNGADPTPANNQSTDTTPVTAAPDLRIVKSDGGASSTPGGVIVYTLTYSNAGNQADTNVVITDVVPANSTFNAGSSTVGWTCLPNNNAGSTCSLSIGTVAGGGAGGAVTFAVTVVTPLPTGVTQISNTACVAGDEDLGPNCGSDDTPVPAAPDMTIVKSDGGVSTVPGGTVVYTLTYANVGNQNATGVTITDTVPTNSTFNPGASTVGWGCVPNNNAGSLCTISIGAVAGGGAGGAVTFAVTVVTPLPTGVTQISNTAWVQDDGNNGADPTPANNQSTDTTPVTAAPDLTLSKTDGGISSVPGGTVVYTLTYTNVGNQNATGVVITETLPTNSSFNAAASLPTVWTAVGGGLYTTPIGAVAGGGGAGTVKFAVTVVNPLPGGVTTIFNTAIVGDDGANGPDPTPANNTATDTTPVAAGVDLTLSKTDGGISTVPGGTVVYTLTYTNVGTQGATGVVITETLPANSSFNAAAGLPTVWTAVGGGLYTTPIGAVAGGGGTGTVKFAVTVVNPLPAGVTQINNSAVVGDDGASGPDQNPANNTATDTTPVNAAPDLRIVKSDGGASSTPGGVMVYTLTYANVGNQNATGVTITDTVPTNSTFNPGASTVGWACVPNNNAGSLCTISIGAVAGGGAGGAVTFAVTVVTPLPTGVTQITNTAWVQDDGNNGADPTPANNQSTDTTPVTATPDLTLSKTDGGISSVPGGTVVYTLTYTNVGNQNATGVVITETLPTNSSFNAAASLPTVWTAVGGGLYTTPIGAVAGGGGAGTVKFAVTVVNPLPGGVTTIFNTAIVGDDGANGPDPTPANNTATDTTPVAAGVDLTLSKTDGGISTVPGGTVVYTLTYTNVGTQGATGVVITETLPANSSFNAAASLPTVWTAVGGGLYTTPIGAVAGGGGAGTVKFAVTVVNPLPGGVTSIFNTAIVGDDGASGPDQNPANNIATDTTPVNAAPDLSILKDDGGITTKPGEIVTYTLIYANGGLGNQDATGVIITDTIPLHTTFNPTASTPGWVCVPDNNAGSVCTFTVGSLPLGANSSVNFAITVDNYITTSLTLVNFAFISDDGLNGPDMNPADNSDGDTTPVSPPTAIQFGSFTGRRLSNGIRLGWSTLSELDIVGFNVYRSPSPKSHGERVNATLIPAAGLPDGSGQYSAFDAGVTSGETVYYWLEAVGANSSQWFGPIAPRWDNRVYLPLNNK